MGDVVKYEDSLHYCIRQTTGTFIAMDWVPYDLYTISTLLDSLQWNKLGVDAVTSVITQDQLKFPSNFAVDMAMTGIRSTRTEYSSSATYSKGDYVIYWGGLYRAKQNIGTPEAWDPSHWELVDLTTLKAGVDTNADAINAISSTIGKLLHSSLINSSTSSVTVNGISQYNIFIAKMMSDYGSGVAVGIRYSSTNIRFVGISQYSSPSCVSSYLTLTMSGDTIVSVGTSLGSDAKGIDAIYGVC